MITPSASTLSGMNFLSSGISAIGQILKGKQEQEAYNKNASIYEDEAQNARLRASIDEFRARKSLDSAIGSQKAAYAGAGVNVNTGTPIDTMVDSLANGYLEIAIEKYNNEIAARSYESQASMQRYSGKQVRKTANIHAGLTLLQGASKYYTKQKKVG